MIKPQSSSHWYTIDGEPRFDANLRDARKENLLPSITTVIKVLSKPALEVWKQNQLLMACLTTERQEDESEENFIKRIIDDSREHGKQAAEYGNIIHKLIERYLKKECIQMNQYDKDLQLTMVDVFQWIDNNIEYAEIIETPYPQVELGYAGTMDLYCKLKDGRMAIIDWKTTGTKPGKKVLGYDNYIQLAAQKMLIESVMKVDVCLNVMISSTEPGRIEVIEWSQEDIERGKEIFKSLVTIFRETKKFKYEVK